MKQPLFNNRLFPKRNLFIAAIIVFALSVISTFYFKVKPSVVHEKNILENYIHEQQRSYNHLVGDSVLMRQLVLGAEGEQEFRELAGKQYGIFIYAQTLSGQPELLFWNNQKILPQVADHSLADGEYFRLLANGYYLTIKRTIRLSGMSNEIIAYAMIPVYYKYRVISKYLQPHFAHSEDAILKIALSNNKTPYVIRSLDNRPLFYITSKAHTTVATSDLLTIILRIATFVLLLLYLHFVADVISKEVGVTRSILFLTTVLISARLFLYFFPDVLQLRQFELFNPGVYASNWTWQRSLGDLLLNAILFSWLVISSWYWIGPVKRLPYFLNGKRIIVAGILALVFFILATFQLADIVHSLVADSKISFNVTDFFSLKTYSFTGFVVLALICLGYYYFTRILFRLIFPAFEGRIVYVYFIIAFLGLAFLSFNKSQSAILFHLPVLLWLVIYTLLFSQEQFIINRFKMTIASILFWTFVFSISLSFVILQANRVKEWNERKALAEKLDQLTNPYSEKLLSIALAYLDSQFLVKNFSRFENKEQNRVLRDSILTENFPNYNSGYNTKLYVFDSANKSVNNYDATNYTELNTIFSIQSKPTNTPDLSYHETSFDKFVYITKRLIKDSARQLGTFFILSIPKQSSAEALLPELFQRSNEIDAKDNPTYSYAIYDSARLKSSSINYPFVINLPDRQIPKTESEKRFNSGYDELWYNAGNQKVVVIAKKQNTILESITLFSYLFCAFLLMIAIFRIVALLLRAINHREAINEFWQFNIRSQVHSTIIFICLLSFIIIGIATISFFIERYNRNNIDRLSHTALIMVKEMQQQGINQHTFNSVANPYDWVSAYSLQNLTNEIAEIHGVDLTLYDPEGDLKVSSQKNVYDKGILSSKMHPDAFYHLDKLNQVQYVHEETMGSLSYLSIYTAVRNDNGDVYAYLNIPYFTSQIDIRQEISNFLITIINLNAFIFLIAGVVALFITNRITRSFSVIGDKMKAITLGKTNEEIIWARNDEIGELVKQYNKMVHQLESSAVSLAKSEREGAWREMARQVAHEIKNPLTPMKLSIQYLQRAITNNQPNVKELTTNVAHTLVEQIDHLSKIAADFSRFANIGNKHIEVFDLHTVLAGLVDLYSSNPKVRLMWEKVEGEVIMEADKTHMNRLFTNLITNALDACTDKERCFIEIIEAWEGEQILIQVKDNGEGILEEMHAKIFTPNFTTKTSGTGLGLAMCKSIVEGAGGSIWFETAEGIETTFFVRLPVMHSEWSMVNGQ